MSVATEARSRSAVAHTVVVEHVNGCLRCQANEDGQGYRACSERYELDRVSTAADAEAALASIGTNVNGIYGPMG